MNFGMMASASTSVPLSRRPPRSFWFKPSLSLSERRDQRKAAFADRQRFGRLGVCDDNTGLAVVVIIVNLRTLRRPIGRSLRNSLGGAGTSAATPRGLHGEARTSQNS